MTHKEYLFGNVFVKFIYYDLFFNLNILKNLYDLYFN